MEKQINNIKLQAESFKIVDSTGLEKFKKKFISNKSIVADLFKQLATLPVDQKKQNGILLNNLKAYCLEQFNLFSKKIHSNIDLKEKSKEDLTLPPASNLIGSMHPISLILYKSINLLSKIGFVASEGPEIEGEWYNFTALNFPPDHPARDMQDTFYVKNAALRTQTSSAQIRVMEKYTPPIRIISYGRVYRKEDISARAHCYFHQIESLYINKNVTFIDLKETLLYLLKNLFGTNITMRLRPSYFPFTEPSVEVDISCSICKKKGCKICKNTGWVEILGAGMVDPQVLSNCKIDPKIYRGFAFGMGIERVTMLLHQIEDLRLFTENDLRFLEQFKHIPHF